MASSILQLRQVESDAGTTALLAEDMSLRSKEGGVMLHHLIRWRGYGPADDNVYLSPEEMDMLVAWWSQQREKWEKKS